MPTVQISLTKPKKIRGGRKRRHNFLEKQKKLLHKELLNCPEKVKEIAADISNINEKIQTIVNQPTHEPFQDKNEEILMKLVKLQSLLSKSVN